MEKELSDKELESATGGVMNGQKTWILSCLKYLSSSITQKFTFKDMNEAYTKLDEMQKNGYKMYHGVLITYNL